MQNRKRVLANDNCVICGSHHPSLVSDNVDRFSTSALRKGAGIIQLSFGYGSALDTARVYGVICDGCAKALIETSAEPFSEDGPLGKTFTSTVDMNSTNDES